MRINSHVLGFLKGLSVHIILAVLLVTAFVVRRALKEPTPTLLEQVKAERVKNISEQEKRRQEAVMEERRNVTELLGKGWENLLVIHKENATFFEKGGLFVGRDCKWDYIQHVGWKSICSDAWRVSVPEEAK